MKKLILFIAGLAFAGLAFGDFQPMDGTTQKATYRDTNFIYFAMSYYQRQEVPSMKYYIKPFHCKIWTDYISDPGFGVRILIGAGNAILEGTYSSYHYDIILTKDNPIYLGAYFGMVEDMYRGQPAADLYNQGCSAFDSHCKPDAYPTVYETCDLTLAKE